MGISPRTNDNSKAAPALKERAQPNAWIAGARSKTEWLGAFACEALPCHRFALRNCPTISAP